MDALSVAVVANGLLAEYVRIHDDIFARSFWRSIRRIIPIPGIFEAIPYATHANSLAVLRNELRLLRGEAAALEAPDSRPSMVRFCMAFETSQPRLTRLHRN